LWHLTFVTLSVSLLLFHPTINHHLQVELANRETDKRELVESSRNARNGVVLFSYIIVTLAISISIYFLGMVFINM